MIVKKKDGYFVVSKKTKRNLGGPYKKREEALKRLRQVEFFKHQKGNVLILFLVLALLGGGIGFFVYIKTKPASVAPQNKVEVKSERTKTDKYKISDIYFLQKELYVNYGQAGLSYPETLPVSTGYSTYRVTEQLDYASLNSGTDYRITTKLSDGSIYSVQSKDYPQAPTVEDATKDTQRTAGLMMLFHSLKGYRNDKGRYPDKLTDLVEAGWVGKMATDPSGVDYDYEVDLIKDRFDLSANLSNGVEFIFRSDMDI